jgi:multidrug efflux pump
LTTPVVYILMDKLRSRSPSETHLSRTHGEQATAAPTTP